MLNCGLLKSFAMGVAAAMVSMAEAGEKVYWTTPTTIYRANADGSDVFAAVRPHVLYPQDVAADLLHGKVYWANGDNSLFRANLDGSETEAVASFAVVNPFNVDRPLNVDVDAAAGKVYWRTFHGLLERADLDGANRVTLHTIPVPSDSYLASFTGLALDLAAGKVYWSVWIGNTDGYFQRANLDGSNVETINFFSSDPLPQPIPSDVYRPGGMAVDSAAGKLYWTQYTHDARPGRVRRANVDGTNREDLVTIFDTPEAIDVDPSGGLMYFSVTTQYPGGLVDRSG